MDDRELEARLKTRLHARFDEAQVPAELATNVRQAFGTTTRRVGFDLRTRRAWLGWPAVAAVAAIVVGVLIVRNIAAPIGPGNPPSASPGPTAGAERQFIVLAPAGLPSKPESSLAGDVLAARIRALGIGNFTSSTGYAIEFILPADGPSHAAIRAVLAATGDVQFVPLPVADYGLGVGKRQAAIGQPLPKDEPPLFGWEGIESVTPSYDTATRKRTVNVSLKPLTAAAFADYTTSHIGETFAILIDGRVAMLPVIDEAITGGEIQVSGGPEEDFAVTAAIMIGGMVPAAWRGASVPAVVSEALAISVARERFPYNPVATSDLTAEPDGDGWRAVWLVDVTGVVSAVIPCPTPGPGATCPVPSPIRRVVIDAVRGTVIRIETPTE